MVLHGWSSLNSEEIQEENAAAGCASLGAGGGDHETLRRVVASGGRDHKALADGAAVAS
jgi:hypothetical protein